MTALHTHGARVGVARLGAALGIPRATASRWRRPAVHTVRPPRAASTRALPAATQAEALAYLHDARFCDAAPAQVHATLLDDGIYVCSVRTMYRLLDAESAVRERRALRTHAGVIDAGFRTIVRATGPDRTEFLQGMLTNDVATLATGQGCGSLQLTIQGRVLADVRVAADATETLLDVDRRVRDAWVAALEKLIIADDIELADPVPPLALLGIEGPAVTDLIPASNALAPYAWTMVELAGVRVRCVRASELRGPGVVLHVPADAVVAVWEALVGRGAVPCGMIALEARRLEVGVPRIGLDMDEHCLSLEVPVDDLVSFRKGCYLGQEVVARGTARGHVNRKLVGLRCEAEAVSGTVLRREGKDVGLLTSVVRVPGSGAAVAMGFVRREHWEVGTVLELVTGGRAVVAAWPLA